MLRRFGPPARHSSHPCRDFAWNLDKSYSFHVSNCEEDRLPHDLTTDINHLNLIFPYRIKPLKDTVAMSPLFEKVIWGVQEYPKLHSVTFTGYGPNGYPSTVASTSYPTASANLVSATHDRIIAREWERIGHTSVRLGPSHVEFLEDTAAKTLCYCYAHMDECDVSNIKAISTSIEELSMNGIPASLHRAIVAGISSDRRLSTNFLLSSSPKLLNNDNWDDNMAASMKFVKVLKVDCGYDKNVWEADRILEHPVKFPNLEEIWLHGVTMSHATLNMFFEFVREVQTLRVVRLDLYHVGGNQCMEKRIHFIKLLRALIQAPHIKVIQWNDIPTVVSPMMFDYIRQLQCQVLSLGFTKDAPEDKFGGYGLFQAAGTMSNLGAIDPEVAQLLPDHTGLSVFTGYTMEALMRGGDLPDWDALTKQQWADVASTESINKTKHAFPSTAPKKAKRSATQISQSQPWSA